MAGALGVNTTLTPLTLTMSFLCCLSFSLSLSRSLSIFQGHRQSGHGGVLDLSTHAGQRRRWFFHRGAHLITTGKITEHQQTGVTVVVIMINYGMFCFSLIAWKPVLNDNHSCKLTCDSDFFFFYDIRRSSEWRCYYLFRTENVVI